MKVLAHSVEDYQRRDACSERERQACPSMCQTEACSPSPCYSEECLTQCYEGIVDACVSECKAAAGDDPEKSLLCESDAGLLVEAEQGLKTKIDLLIGGDTVRPIPSWDL